MAKLLLVFAHVLVVCLCSDSENGGMLHTTLRTTYPITRASYTSKPTSYTTPTYSSSTVPNHRNGHTYYYYMDSTQYCTPSSIAHTQGFYSCSDAAYVKAWSTSTYPLSPIGSCSYTFSSNANHDLRFKFTSLLISDCNVKVNLYRGASTFGTPDYTFSCRDTAYSSYSKYRKASNGYLTIELVNPKQSTDFFFTFYIRNQRTTGSSIAVGLSVGLGVTFIILLVSAIVICRRRRLRRMREQPIVATTTSTTANYNYPVGQATYPNSYESAAQSKHASPPTGAYPQQSGAYPPPAGAYPPPVYSENNEPPAGAYNQAYNH